MYSFFLNKGIDEKALHSCYFFYGEEPFLAEEFIGELKQAVVSPEDQDYNIDKCNLDENSWMAIIDLARSVPFFFSSWRMIKVSLSIGKGEYQWDVVGVSKCAMEQIGRAFARGDDAVVFE